MSDTTVKSEKGDFFKGNGGALKPTGKLTVQGHVKTPVEKKSKTTEGKSVTAGIKGGQPSLGAGEVNPVNCPLEKVDIKTPVCDKKTNCDSATESTEFKFDAIWRQLTEADGTDDMPIGGDLDAPAANIEGDSFDDDTGDFDEIDDEEDDADAVADDDDDIRSFLRGIRDQINDFLGEAEDDESDLLDDEDTELDDEEGDIEAAEAGAPPPPAPAAGAGAPPPPAPAPQTESWQRKTAFGPKMSDKAPGKLGKKKKGGKCGKGSLKKNTTLQDAKGKKVPLSKFSPKMSDKVSRLKKGDLF